MATDYTPLITNAHADKPRFLETVRLLTSAASAIADVALSLTQAFSVDEAVGVQLDTVGLWVGISRRQNVPIPNAFFTWDDADLGWNVGSWKGPFVSTEGITVLDDDTYRAVIKAKIGSNYWNGSMLGLQQIGERDLQSVGVQCFVLDNMDMSVTVYILGQPTAVLVEMIKRGITPPKTAGVRVAGYILASEAGAPFFALSVSTTPEVAGLDFGSFGEPVL
jgi:hypothetical protein